MHGQLKVYMLLKQSLLPKVFFGEFWQTASNAWNYLTAAIVVAMKVYVLPSLVRMCKSLEICPQNVFRISLQVTSSIFAAFPTSLFQIRELDKHHH